ncbi:LysE family translocator [Streptomyces evansiae]|uniref:LysE family translocator n=1 Tax=Streptomyces evansiae TaxID=3075535 RepID=UPI0028847E15|nr:LysE family transporter [Streptomyces sp. DSM 41859]MDT0425464.1 LysE family transporter [Streptomyces sp. DSM 41859]
MNAPLPPAALGGFALAVLPFVVTPGASLALVTRHPARAAPVVLGTVGGLYVHAALVTAGLAALLANHPHVLLALRLAGAGYLVLLGVRLWRAEGGGEGEEETGDDADGVGAAGGSAAGGGAAGGGKAADRAAGDSAAGGGAGADGTAEDSAAEGGAGADGTGEDSAAGGCAGADGTAEDSAAEVGKAADGTAGDSATGNDRASGRAGDAGEGRAGWRLGVEALLANVLNPKALSLYLVLLPRFLHTHGRVLPQVLTLTTVHALLHTAWLLGWAHLAGRGPRRAAGRGVRRGLAVVLVGAGLWNVVA